MAESAVLSPLALLRDIEARSRDHAADLPQQQQDAEVWSGISFRLGDHYLTVSLAQVQEVQGMLPVSRVPGSRRWLKGVANARGRLLTVVDLAAYLWDGSVQSGRRNRLLMLHQGDLDCGLVVDEVLGIKHFQKEESDAEPPAYPDGLADYVDACFLHEGQAWGVLDLQALASSERFMSAAAP